MIHPPIYFDNHATTRVDPRVVEALLPYFTETFGNAGSTTHSFGSDAKDAVDQSREKIAAAVGARAKEIVFTSGATESNNLALRGVAERYADKGRHIVSVVTEHPSVLDPLERLRRRGFEVTLLPVVLAPDPRAGLVRAEDVARAIRDDTVLVSIMLANNEIGAIHPLAEIAALCKERSVLLHTDATQAVGKIPVNVEQLQVDLMSFTAHKMYGPKGVGALYVRSRNPRVKLEPQTDGGGQESGLRSGTLNVPGIVGFSRAMELCIEEMPTESERIRGLRDRLLAGLEAALPGVTLNGPANGPPLPSGEGRGEGRSETSGNSGYPSEHEHTLSLALSGAPAQRVVERGPHLRLPGNLNVSFAGIEAETLLISMSDVAASTGSACSSANPEPSHVLRALGLSDEAIRGSIRFGLGRFNTLEEVDFVIQLAAETVTRLREMSSL